VGKVSTHRAANENPTRAKNARVGHPRFTCATRPWSPGGEPTNDPRVQVIAAAAHDLVAKRDAWLSPLGATESELKKRTLTNLYNQRPTWLAEAHRRLDEAVLAAYGWPADISDDEILARLLALNQDRAGQQSRGA